MKGGNQISEALRHHYRETFEAHGMTSEGVDWGSNEEAVEIRHRVMSRLIAEPGGTLLDVGCGYGAFYDYLQKVGVEVQYTGIDVVSEMIEAASLRHPKASFVCGDILEEALPSFDFVVCNGIFTQKLDCSQQLMWEFVKEVVRAMWGVARVGVAFNVMSSHVNFHSDNLFYKSPTELVAWISQEITTSYVIDHSYPLYEYTAFLYRKGEYTQE